jgi:phospholipid/cholesterol/gamma-HCH transport system substrate-binding protein
MRTRKKDQTNLIKVGVFISLLTFVAMIMIASIGKENSFFASKVILRARVANVSNLKPGSYVEFKGIRIGAVSRIQIVSQEEVEITMQVLRDEIKWIKQDSRVTVSNAGLVGDKFLEIHNGSSESPPLNPETDVLIQGAQTDFGMILNKGESIAGVTDRILHKIDRILTNMEDGKKLVETMNALHKVSFNLEVMTTEFRQAKLGETAKSVNSSMAKMEQIMTRIEKGPGTMNSLIYDDGLHDDLRALLGGAQRNKVIKYFIRESIKKSEKRSED